MSLFIAPAVAVSYGPQNPTFQDFLVVLFVEFLKQVGFWRYR